MALTIKEIRVVTTVVRGIADERELSDEALGRLKREIVDELKRAENRIRRKKEDER